MHGFQVLRSRPCLRPSVGNRAGGAGAKAGRESSSPPHRAVYDLKLATARGNKPVESVRGRILYDFSGSACEGYALQFRQVSEIDTGEGSTLTSDLRATTWEDGAAKTFRFNSQNLHRREADDSVDGQAERTGDRRRRQPDQAGGEEVRPRSERHLSFRPSTCAASSRRRARARRCWKRRSMTARTTGEKLYDTLTVIGTPIAPQAKKPADAAAQGRRCC